MEHLECVRRWPSLYSVMALVMDDVSLDRDKAISKWGYEVVRLSETRNNSAIHEDDVKLFVLMWAEGLNMSLLNGKIATPPIPAIVGEPQPAGGGTASTAPTNPGGPVPSGHAGTGDFDEPGRANYKARPKSAKSHKAQKVTGSIVKAYHEEKHAKYGGGMRPMIEVMLDGQKNPVAGTCPSAMVGKVKAGDRVQFEAQVWSFDGRPGWFKYPAKMKVVSS